MKVLASFIHLVSGHRCPLICVSESSTVAAWVWINVSEGSCAWCPRTVLLGGGVEVLSGRDPKWPFLGQCGLTLQGDCGIAVSSSCSLPGWWEQFSFSMCSPMMHCIFREQNLCDCSVMNLQNSEANKTVLYQLIISASSIVIEIWQTGDGEGAPIWILRESNNTGSHKSSLWF